MMLSATDTAQTRVAPQQRRPLEALAAAPALLITAAYDSGSRRKQAFTCIYAAHLKGLVFTLPPHVAAGGS